MRMLVAAVAITTIATALHAEEPPLPLPVSGVHDATVLIRVESAPCKRELFSPITYHACLEAEADRRREHALEVLELGPVDRSMPP